jgi:prevent-host-death family protein
MAKRTLKHPAKSAASKQKAAEPREFRYAREGDDSHIGVREVSPLPYGSSPPDRRSVPATQAKNRFGEILQTAREAGPVFIERHGQAQAVVLGIDTYNKLISNERSSQQRELDYWTRQFQALHARMQSPEARQAVDDLFSATDAELNHRGS